MSSRYCSVRSGLMFMLLSCVVASQGVAFGGAPARKVGPSQTEDKELMAVFSRYAQESAQPRKGEDRKKFVSFWEGEFAKALSSGKGSSFLRMRMMREFGMLQRSVGKKKEAAQTYKDLAALAKESNDLDNQAAAAENQLEISGQEPMDVVKKLAIEFEDLASQLAARKDTQDSQKRYCDSLVHAGVLLMSRAKASDASAKGANPRELIEQAQKVFERSVALGDVGTTPVVSRLDWVARSQSALGRREEAAATYGKILAMDQNVLSRLWIEYLRIGETTVKDSDEYRKAMERALADFEKRGGKDDYEITMRHLLGRSYRSARQYARSTEILSAIIGKSGDPDMDGFNMYLVAMNALDSGDVVTGRELLREVGKQYPKSGSAKIAARLLDEVPSEGKGERDAVQTPRAKFGTWLIAGQVLLLAAILAVIVLARRRRVRKQS